MNHPILYFSVPKDLMNPCITQTQYNIKYLNFNVICIV